MYYKECGNKGSSLLVFLHGGGVSGWMWDKQIQHFSNYHCVVVDLPEQGKSTNLVDFSIKSSAEKVMALIEQLANGQKVIVIGFSLGAQVAVQMVSMKQNLIDYAMINSALVRPNIVARRLIEPTIRMSYPLIKNRNFAKLQAQTLYVPHEYFATYFNESSQMKRTTLIRILQENISFTIPEDFYQTKSNVLVTVGEKEREVMKKSANDIVNANSNCQGIIISGVGHGIPLAEPELFNELIENWLQEIGLSS